MLRKFALGLVLAGAVPAVARAQDPPPAPAPADVSRELDALVKEVEAEGAAFEKAYGEARTDAEREAAAAKAPGPADGKKFWALAAKAKGTDAGVKALLWAGRLGAVLPGTPEMKQELEWIATAVRSPALEELLPELAEMTTRMGQPDEALAKTLAQVAADSPHTNVRAAALLALGDVQSALGHEVAAREALEKLAKDYADSPHAAAAKGRLFAVRYLAVGKTPPDFEATDIEGKKWKLSEYRGKVVALVFWGFW